MSQEAYPLTGVRVLDFTHVLAGPFCTRLLADFGADVVKVESVLRPDRLGATLPKPDFGGRRDRTATFLSLNRSKRSIAINLKSDEGRRLAVQLASVADVVVENFSSRVMERLGLGYENLSRDNRGLVYMSMSGYGHTGPRRHGTSMNMTLQAYSGLMMATGREGDLPMSIANSWNDYIGGFHACLAAVNALSERASTGTGRQIDLSQFECSVSTLGPLLLASSVNQALPKKWGNRSPAAAPQGVYRCAGKDEWCAITVGGNAQWRALVQAAGLSEYAQDPELARFIGRQRRHDEIDRAIETWTTQLSAVDVESRLLNLGIPARRMRRAVDLVESGAETGAFRTLDEQNGWSSLVTGVPFSFSRELPDPIRAPRLGEHSAAVLQEWLGLSGHAGVEPAVADVRERVPG